MDPATPTSHTLRDLVRATAGALLLRLHDDFDREAACLVPASSSANAKPLSLSLPVWASPPVMGEMQPIVTAPLAAHTAPPSLHEGDLGDLIDGPLAEDFDAVLGDVQHLLEAHAV